MKFALGVSALILVIMVSAIESNELSGPSTSQEAIPAPYIERGNRQRRVTCDLLSFDSKWGSINHAACAAHCLAMMKGFRGGYCNDKGVCVCRK